MNFFTKMTSLFLIAAIPLFSDCCTPFQLSEKSFKTAPLQLYIAPEIYHVHRKRAGGAKQNGMIFGVRAGYDKIKGSKIYYGFDALYAKGPLKGKGASGNSLKSNFTDISVEGRLGYTLKYKCFYKPLFTPFIGIGQFIEKNHFTHPKVTPIHFNTSYLYGTVGFLSRIRLKDRFFVGINFKIKYPYDAECRVSNDPKNDNSKQIIKEKMQYRVELPMSYQVYKNSDCLNFSFVPFYELRQYGYHPNYPCDFLETNLNIYGIQLKMIYCL